MSGNLLVIHTTEGSTIAGAVAAMTKNRSQSNTVFNPETNEEHVFSESPNDDRSLRNASGGVQTNNRQGVWQIEIVGFAGKTASYSDKWYANLAAYLRRKCADWGIPYTFSYAFRDVNQAYGTSAPTRLTAAQWNAASGIVGHQHVPENAHWDPGPIDVARLHGEEPAVSDTVEVKEEYVVALQGALVYAGFNLGTSGPDRNGIDGDFGPKTLAAAKSALEGYMQGVTEVKTLRAQQAALEATAADLEDRLAEALAKEPAVVEAELAEDEKRWLNVGQCVEFILKNGVGTD